jgi:hypothetical protein
MPLPTARKLGDLVAASTGALRLLAAAAEGPSASRMLAATGANVHVVRLLDPMSEEETREYVAARLARARIPASIAARFDEAALASIHRLSAGIPRRVHSVASALLRGEPPESAGDGEVERDATPALADARAPEPAGSATREEEILPAYEALRQVAAPRAETRIEAAPSAWAVFATALLVRVGRVALRRALLLSPPPRARPAAIAPAPAPVAPPARVEAPAPPAAPAASTVSVQVNARPWANIEVDGVDFGPTPIAGIPLLAGPHRFRARLPDGRVLEREVDVTAENRFVVFE